MFILLVACNFVLQLSHLYLSRVFTAQVVLLSWMAVKFFLSAQDFLPGVGAELFEMELVSGLFLSWNVLR